MIRDQIKDFLNKRDTLKTLSSIDFKTANVVVLTGAGISEESGLSTFRDQGGLWENHKIEDVCTPQAFITNPERVLSFYNQRREQFVKSNIRPNAAHEALKKLEDSLGNRLTIITQNIDALHELAGSKNVIHVHGEINKNKCAVCQHVYESQGSIPYPNECSRCLSKNSQRPNVVFFKEDLQHTIVIEKVLNKCQLIIAIGTSGVVYPVAFYPSLVQDQGGLSLCLNKEVPANSAYFNHVLLGSATKLVPSIVDFILDRA